MPHQLTRIGASLRARAENLLAAMLFVMFSAFIIQIVCRYILNLPVGWTHEVSVVMWLWLVLFGTAFVVRDSEEIRFDLIYGSVSNRTRRVLIVVSALIVVGLFSIALPAVIDYLLFMKVERTAYLKVRFDFLYSIYGFFAVAVIIRQLWLAGQAVWGREPEAVDVTQIKSGV
ncbi:MAG: transporter small permease subunit [Devosia sp.]|nr:transporter small permease subunit [Devosia sp.]